MKQQTVYNGPVFQSALQDSLQRHQLILSSSMAEQIQQYYRLLIEGNNKMNLTAITEPAAAAEKHVADCLHLAPLLPDRGLVADVGSGAGLPGLLLAIVRPDLSFHLIDALAKRCRFLTETAATLGLENVTVHHLRAEAAGRETALRGKCDCVTARALASLPVLLELTLPLLRPQGRLLAMKGDKGEQELAASQSVLSLLQAKADQVLCYRLQSGEQRTILTVVQQRPCAKQYPRREGLPERQPLGQTTAVPSGGLDHAWTRKKQNPNKV